MAFPGKPFFSLIVHACTLKPDKRDHAPQKEIDLFKVGQFFQHSFTEQPVIGMIENNFRAEPFQAVIKTFRRNSFKSRIGLPFLPYSVYDLTAVIICVDHRVHGVDIILTVTVNADCNIRIPLRLHKSCPKSILVPSVPGKCKSCKTGIRLRQFRDDLPCVVPGTIVYKQDFARLADLPVPDQGTYFFREHPARNGKHFFLIIAWHNNI